jgi:hypothetical protein
VDYQAMARSFRPLPPKRKATIAIDRSHGQGEWPLPPDFARPESEQTVFGYAEHTADWNFYPLTSGMHFLSRTLWEASGLLMAAPLRSHIGAETINVIHQWVFAGGRLLLLGFEYGDLHHGGNLGALAGQFGIHFGTDIIGPPGFGGEKPYDVPVEFRVSDADPYPFTDGLQSLSLTNVQTVGVAPGGTEWLRVGRNVVYRPARETVDYVQKTLCQRGSQRCDQLTNLGGTPVAVTAPSGLCGQGAVCAIGTWQVRNADPGTQKLLERLLRWLAGEA